MFRAPRIAVVRLPRPGGVAGPAGSLRGPRPRVCGFLAGVRLLVPRVNLFIPGVSLLVLGVSLLVPGVSRPVVPRSGRLTTRLGLAGRSGTLLLGHTLERPRRAG